MTPPVHVGQVLAGKYRLERVLGMGGMGIVVAARHLHLDERVAIKFLQPDALANPTLVARFLREAKAAAKIRSEHVARVFDVGTLDDGAPYLVMEYLEGSDLAALVKQHGSLPIAVAVEYVLQACEAIAEAHAAGIIHRDLKPANLFVTARADGSHVVKVIDFGISKMATGDGAGLDITKTAEMRGSLLFMPPEQMSRPRDADARSDIWAIGVSLFNLLTGAYPFRAETVPELCAKVFHEEPIPPRALRPEIPSALEAAILQCLRKNPAQRFGNVAKLAAVLVEFGTPASRISAERIARTLTAGRATQPSVPAIQVESGTSAPPGFEPVKVGSAVQPTSTALEVPASTAADVLSKEVVPPGGASSYGMNVAQTSPRIQPVGTGYHSSRKHFTLISVLAALAAVVIVMTIIVVSTQLRTPDAGPPAASAPAIAVVPQLEETASGVEPLPAPAMPATTSATPASSGARAPVPISTGSAGVISGSGVKRGSAASPTLPRAPGTAPAPAPDSQKKSKDHLFEKPD